MNRHFELEPETHACRCCGATVGQHDCGRERFLDAGQSLMRCDQCGVAYLTPDFTDTALDDFYTNHYRSLFLFDVAKRYDKVFFKHTLYRESAAARAAIIAPQLPPNAQLLEIGSGFGAFIGQLHALRPDIIFYAIESDVTNRMLLLDGANVRFITRDEVAAHAPYDVIVAFHVVEHMKHPVADILHFCALLNDTGQMMIEVPDAASDWGGWFFVQPAHVSYFTAPSLRRMLQRAGVDITSVGPHPGGIAFESMLWASVTKGSGEYVPMVPATDTENALFAAHIAHYRYRFKQRLRKTLKEIGVMIIGAKRIGAMQRRKVYRTMRKLYPVLTIRR